MKQKYLKMWIRRALIFISSSFFFLALLEFGLGVSSYFHRSPTKSHDAAKTILCLGNSFTYGVGASPEKSYPVQLQEFFDKAGPQKIQVVNAGQANINSSYQLNHLEEALNQYHPDVVILQTGEPNKWNHQGYAEYLTGEEHHSWSFFNDTHIGKFIAYLRFGPHQKELSAAEVEYPLHRYRDEYWQAITWSHVVRSTKTEKNSTNDQLAENHLRWLKRGILFDSFNPQSYASIGIIYYYYYGNFDEAIKWAVLGLKVNPYVYDMTDSIALIRVLQKTTDPKNIDLVKKYEQDFPQIFKTLAFENDPRLWEWAKSDLEKMITIIKNKKIKLLLLDYPPVPRLPLTKRPIDDVIKKLATEHQIPFLSIYDVFSSRSSQTNFFKEHYWEQFGVFDEHPSAQGYGLIAHEIYQYLNKEKLL